MVERRAAEFTTYWRLQFPDVTAPLLSCFAERDDSKLHFDSLLAENLASATRRVAQLEQALAHERFIVSYLEQLTEKTRAETSHDNRSRSPGLTQRPLRPKVPDSARLSPAFPKHVLIQQSVVTKLSKSESLSVANIKSECSLHTRPESVLVSNLSYNVSPNFIQREQLSGNKDTLSVASLRKVRSTDDVLLESNTSKSDVTKQTFDIDPLDSSTRLPLEELQWPTQSSGIANETQQLELLERDRSMTGSTASQSQEDLEEYLADEPSGPVAGSECRLGTDSDLASTTLALAIDLEDGGNQLETAKTTSQTQSDTVAKNEPVHPARSIHARRLTINERLSHSVNAIIMAAAANDNIEEEATRPAPPSRDSGAPQMSIRPETEVAEMSVDRNSPAKHRMTAAIVKAGADEQERIEVLNSVLESEAAFLDVLDILNQYMKSMEASATTSARFMPLESVQIIFSRVRDLNNLHKHFYEQLRARVNQAQLFIDCGDSGSGLPLLRVADLFLPLISQLNIARDYANNYARAIHTVKRYTVENAQFAELARAVRLKRSKETCTLETLLFRPVVRLQRHVDILRELLAVTKTSHADYAELEAMLKIAQQTVANSISQAVLMAGPQPVSTTPLFGGHTMDSFSPGSLVRASLMVELVHEARKLRHVFLFSNLFVCAKYIQTSDQFEIKWFVPLRELIVYKVDDNLQEDTRAKRRVEVDAIKQRIAALRAELRRELQRSPSTTDLRKNSRSNDGLELQLGISAGSNSNLKEASSMWSLSNLRATGLSQQSASIKTIERLRKKLAEQKAALVLASPSLLFELSRNSEKRYRFVMTSKFERDDWKAQIKTLRNRLLPSYSLSAADATPRVTVLEVKALIESCRLVSPQVNELGKVLLASDADLLDEKAASESDSVAADSDSQSSKLHTRGGTGTGTGSVRVSTLSGSLFVTICSLDCPAHRNSDLFVCVEVDSHGCFDLQARTRLVRNATDHVAFDQEFELSLDASQTVRLLCYGRSQSLGEYLIAHADFNLLHDHDFRRADTGRSFSKRQLPLRAVSNDEKPFILECSMRYVAPEQTIKRTALAPSSLKGSLFGVPLETVAKRERLRVPMVVRSCINEVERRGLLEVGVYRISGASSEVQELRRAFERNAVNAGQSLSDRDIHAVSNILKLFIRELPEPLFTDQLYRSLVDGYQLADQTAREKCTLGLLRSLPPFNYATLMCLFDHLIRIADRADANRMTLQNLSTIFGPSLLRPAFRNELIQSRLDSGANTNQPELSLAKLTQDALLEANVVLYCIELRKQFRATQFMPTDDVVDVGSLTAADSASLPTLHGSGSGSDASSAGSLIPSRGRAATDSQMQPAAADVQPGSVKQMLSSIFARSPNSNVTPQRTAVAQLTLDSSSNVLPAIVESSASVKESESESEPNSNANANPAAARLVQTGAPASSISQLPSDRRKPQPPVSSPPRKPTHGPSGRNQKPQEADKSGTSSETMVNRL